MLRRLTAYGLALAAFSLTAISIMMLLLTTEALPVLNELSITWFQHKGGYFGALEFFIRYVVVAFTFVMLYAGNQTRLAFIFILKDKALNVLRIMMTSR